MIEKTDGNPVKTDASTEINAILVMIKVLARTASRV